MNEKIEELMNLAKKYNVIIIIPNDNVGDLQPEVHRVERPITDYIYAKDLITGEERYYPSVTVNSDPDNFRLRSAPTYEDKVEPAAKEEVEKDGE